MQNMIEFENIIIKSIMKNIYSIDGFEQKQINEGKVHPKKKTASTYPPIKLLKN